MKTIKIIDLLNKIANGEEVPKMITSSDIEECEDMIFIYDKDIQDYKTKDEDYFFEIAFNKSYPVLNLKVEVIEEEKEIEKIGKLYILVGNDSAMPTTLQDFNNRDIAIKINELIDAVNSINKGK